MNMNTDAIRASIGLLISQGLNVLVLLSVVNLDIDQLAAINAFVGTLVTTAFFFVKPAS